MTQRLNGSRAPKCAHREDDAKGPGHTERVEGPDEEEGSGGPFDAEARSCHMNDGHARGEERPDEDNDQAPSPVAQQQRPAQIDDEDGDAEDIAEPSSGKTEHDVLRNVERQQDDRE